MASPSTVGAGGEDQLFGFGQTWPEVAQAKLLGADAVDRRERAVEYVIDAGVGAGLLDGVDIGGLFDDADQMRVARGAGAVGAGVDVGDVVADGAEVQMLLEGADGVGERGGVGVGRTQDVEGVALRSLGADAGQLAEFVDEPGHGLGETGSHKNRV